MIITVKRRRGRNATKSNEHHQVTVSYLVIYIFSHANIQTRTYSKSEVVGSSFQNFKLQGPVASGVMRVHFGISDADLQAFVDLVQGVLMEARHQTLGCDVMSTFTFYFIFFLIVLEGSIY